MYAILVYWTGAVGIQRLCHAAATNLHIHVPQDFWGTEQLGRMRPFLLLWRSWLALFVVTRDFFVIIVFRRNNLLYTYAWSPDSLKIEGCSLRDIWDLLGFHKWGMIWYQCDPPGRSGLKPILCSYRRNVIILVTTVQHTFSTCQAHLASTRDVGAAIFTS